MDSTTIERVLISDDIDTICMQLLTLNNIEIEVATKLTRDELKEKIQDFDALIVRSATKVTDDVIAAGRRLKVIGRAGTGIDNIDLDAATKAGIIVMNTPMGNSRSAAELTCAMIMNLARCVPNAVMTTKLGKWDRKVYMGTELYEKTLAIIGLGRIGREVAARMRAFGMRVIGYDPMIDADESRKFDVEWMPLEKIWAESDYITVHVPLMPQTENLINTATFEKCKKGVYVVNCARGGIINEEDLLTALDNGRCGGAALDVYVQEPPTDYRLMKHPKAICTPHLGASTIEAQERVAQEIAEQIISFSLGEKLLGAVNGHALVSTFNHGVKETLKSIVDMSHLLINMCENTKIDRIIIDAPVNMGKCTDESILAAFNIGRLGEKSNERVNLVNAHLYPIGNDMKVIIKRESPSDTAKITSEMEQKIIHTLVSCPSAAGTHLLSIDDSPLANPILLKGILAVYTVERSKTSELVGRLAEKCTSFSRQIDQSIANAFVVATFERNSENGHGPDVDIKPIALVNF